MTRIETRTQLIEFIERHIDRTTIKAAIREGKVFIVGGFWRIQPTNHPGWVILVTSRFDKTWRIAVVTDPDKNDYKALEIQEIPWEHYVENNGLAIYAGDDPNWVKLQRLLARQKKLGDSSPTTEASGENQPNNPQL